MGGPIRVTVLTGTRILSFTFFLMLAVLNLIAINYTFDFACSGIRKLSKEYENVIVDDGFQVTVADVMAFVTLAAFCFVVGSHGAESDLVRQSVPAILVTTLTGCVVASTIWFIGIINLNALHVDHSIARFVFLVVVVPITILGSVFAIPSIVTLVVMFTGIWKWWCIAAIFAITSVLVLSNRLSHWVASKSDLMVKKE